MALKIQTLVDNINRIENTNIVNLLMMNKDQLEDLKLRPLLHVARTTVPENDAFATTVSHHT